MKSFLLIASLLLLLQSCKDADENPSIDSACGQMAIVDNNLYKHFDSESFSIQSVKLIGDCLEVAIQSSGCDGSSWEAKLVDSGNVAESNPEQRYIKVFLNNKELCQAIFGQTFTFDLRPLRTEKNVVLLNLEEWEEQIIYVY